MQPSVSSTGSDYRDRLLLEPILDPGEELRWTGRPVLLPFLLSGAPFLAIGIAWFCIDWFGFIRPMLKGNGPPAGFAIPFFALHLFPFWGSILNMARLMVVRKNTVYAYTNRRMIFRTGAFGIDFRSVDYSRIADLEVNVNPLENALGSGTIRARLDTARMSCSFTGIENPYGVYKELKKVALDIKTDMEYPNAMRPARNPGYGTRYDSGTTDRDGPPPPVR
jgi:hypothetical protein